MKVICLSQIKSGKFNKIENKFNILSVALDI